MQQFLRIKHKCLLHPVEPEDGFLVLHPVFMSRKVDGELPRTANVIDFLEWPGAQRETLCGKLEWEKAHQPQVRKMSMGRPVRGRHRPFQKARGLDQEISRKAFLRPYP